MIFLRDTGAGTRGDAKRESIVRVGIDLRELSCEAIASAWYCPKTIQKCSANLFNRSAKSFTISNSNLRNQSRNNPSWCQYKAAENGLLKPSIVT